MQHLDLDHFFLQPFAHKIYLKQVPSSARPLRKQVDCELWQLSAYFWQPIRDFVFKFILSTLQVPWPLHLCSFPGSGDFAKRVSEGRTWDACLALAEPHSTPRYLVPCGSALNRQERKAALIRMHSPNCERFKLSLLSLVPRSSATVIPFCLPFLFSSLR